MLQRVLQAILRRYFGQFLTGLQNVQLAFWTGRINIQNASFKHDKINQLIKANNLPFSIKFSYIGSLQIDIPWKKLSSAPVQLIISDILIVLKLEGITLSDLNQGNEDLGQNSKFMLIKKYVEYMIKKSTQIKVQSNDSSNGYLNRLIMKIVHNMNIKISNISFRIENQGMLSNSVFIKKESEEENEEMEEFSDVSPQLMNSGSSREFKSISPSEIHPRKLSELSTSSKRRRSTAIKVSQKPFALGFCIKEFIAFTIDEKGQRKFVNIQHQNVQFCKMIQLHEISLYWQQNMIGNMCNRTTQERVEFLKKIIERKEYRLLTVEGSVLLKRNQTETGESDKLKEKRHYAYLLEAGFKELFVEANYEQIREMLLILETIKAQSEKVSIMKLKELEKKEQLALESSYKQLFLSQLYPRNFKLSEPEKSMLNQQQRQKLSQSKLQQIKRIFYGVQKKLLMKWTKETIIEAIKKQKQQERLKQKNKKGWFSFFSTQQDEIKLDENDFMVIEQEIKNLIALTQEKQLKSFMNNLGIDRLVVRVRKYNKEREVQEVALNFIQLKFRLMKFENQTSVKVTVGKIQLTYGDSQQDQRVQILEISERAEQSKLGQSEFYDMADVEELAENHGLEFQWSKTNSPNQNIHNVRLKTQPMILKHEIKVLSFVSHMLKLRHNNQELKSQLIVFKARVQNSLPDEQIQTKNTFYHMQVEIKKIAVFLELNEKSFLYASIDSVGLQSQDNNRHTLNVTDFGLKYIKRPMSEQLKFIKQGPDQSQIINDFSVEAMMAGIKNIQCSISPIRLVLCEDELSSIFECLKSQKQMFSAQKVQYQKEKIIEQTFFQGKVSIINAFRVKYDYLAVLYYDSMVLYNLKKGIQNLEQLILNEDQLNPTLSIPLMRLKATKQSPTQMKLESLFVNEILEIQEQSQTDLWTSTIQQRIFDLRARNQINKLIQQEQKAMEQDRNLTTQKKNLKLLYKYETSIKLQAKRVELLYCSKVDEPFVTVDVNGLGLLLEESNFSFQRKIEVKGIQVIDQTIPEGCRFRNVLSNMIRQHQDQFIKEEDHLNPIKITLSGKKKLHPNYTGELQILIQIKKLLVNFNAELLFNIIQKLSAKGQPVVLSTEARDKFVLECFRKILDSDETRELEEKIQNSEELKDSSNYLDIDRFRQVFTCLTLLKMKIQAEQLSVYMIQGRTCHVPFHAKLTHAYVGIDKGSNFMFVKAMVRTFHLDDLTGYPYTNTQKWQTKERFNLISTLPQRTSLNAVQLYYSTFPTEVIINRDRFRSFTKIIANDLSIVYQNQPLMRFIDYLTNQLILFFMEPQFLHRFNGAVRGPFKYDKFYYTREEIEEYVRNIAVPFFNQLLVDAHNLVIYFNTWPNKEAIKFHIQKVLIHPENRSDAKRISFNVSQLISMQSKYPQFCSLCEVPGFQQKILKSQWWNRLIIQALGMSSSIFKKKFDYEMYHERCLHQEKEFLLPCVKINKDMIQEAVIRNLTIIAPKKIYDLINKCFMFNLSYDDELDWQYNTNFLQQKGQPATQLLYKINVHEFTLLIPEINQTAIIIEDMTYKWLRYPDNLKEMAVTGRAFHILGTKNFIIPFESKTQKGLEYMIEMKLNGDKTMSTFFRDCEIIYDWDLFSILLAYFLLDDSCYPPQKTYPDLPLITCHFYFLDSYIRLAKTQTHYYTLFGDITFTWIRKKIPHPETYRHDRKNFPLGKVGSLYLAKLKECTLRKFERKNYEAQQFMHYRLLSLPISLDMKWSNVMKITHQGHQYTDWIVEYDIKLLFLKLSYIDLQDLKRPFVKEPDPNQLPPEPLPYVQYVQHIFNMEKFTIQLGVSQLPVPLLDVTFEGKIIIELLDKTKTINLEIQNLTSKYWNMLIGRWEPILERLTATSNLKFTTSGIYVIFDSPSIVYLDVSMDSLKVINLISDDFKKQGKNVLNLAKKNMITDELHISPYIITNRTSVTIYVSNNIIQPTAIQNNEKLHLETTFLEDNQQMIGTILVRLEDESKLYEIDLNISSIVRQKVKFKEIEYDLYFQPISSPVVKQIIITSPYVLSNRTSHKVIVSLSTKQYLLNPDEKQAVPFYDILQNKHFRLEFPHLKKPLENYAFTFKDIERGYQHYINLEGEQFNCTLAVRQDKSTEEEDFVEIQIAPVYYFKNLLPVDVVIQFNVSLDKGNRLVTLKLKVNEQKEVYEISTIEDTMFRVQMKGYHFSEFVPLSKVEDPGYAPEEVVLHDHRALDGKVKVKTLEEGKMRRVFLYADAILINESAHNLYAFAGGRLLSGQMVQQIAQSSSRYLMLDQQTDKFLSFGFDQFSPFTSNQIDTTQLGNQELKLLKSEHFFEFTLNNTLQCLDPSAQIYCNLLKIVPKYIIINSTSRVLQLKQFSTQKVIHIMSSQRTLWTWSSYYQQHLLCFKAIDNEAEDMAHDWGYSSGFNLENLEDTVIVLRPVDKKDANKLLIKVEVHQEYQQRFIVFKELVTEQLNMISEDFLLMQNDLKLARIQFCQNCFQRVGDGLEDDDNQPKPFKANPGEKVLFGWENPEMPQELYIKMQFLGPLRARFRTEQFSINIKDKKVIEKHFENSEGESFQIQFVIETIGLKKKIRLREKDLEESIMQMDMLGGGNKVGVSIHELGISLISSGKNRREVLYVSLKKLEVILMEESQLRKIQVKIKYISIDNNTNHNTIYPVLFTPLKHEKTWTKSRPFFVMLIETNLNKEGMTEIKEFRMCLESISLKVHDEVLIKLYDMYKEVGSEERVQQGADLSRVFGSCEKGFEWEVKQMRKLENEIFFRQFEIAKLSIQISFSIRPKISKGNYLIFTILSSFGMAISNISESQLTLSRFFKKQVTLTQLKNQLSEFYIKQFIKGIYKILGSITIFGNPYVFVRLVAEGAWEIVNQPTEGFIKGPIEGTIGIGKGGVFFTRNVIAGTFNSFQAISESLSRGISYMTLDQKFIQRREKIKQQKSNHVFQGMANGLFALYTGFQVAVTGLYRMPAEGYKKDGWKSGLTGALKGVTGLVTKPISGMFQGVSKLSQGIKNTALLFQDGPNTKRARHPRVFLSGQRYYTNYNHLESYTIAFLEHQSTKYLNIDILFISVTENLPENVMKSLILTSKYLLIVDLIQKNVETEIVLADIETVEVVEENIVRISTKYDEEIEIQEEPMKCQELIVAFKMSKQFL